ncbi:hypothetical protein ABPG72_006770 [Tetrahymena utriculariae]
MLKNLPITLHSTTSQKWYFNVQLNITKKIPKNKQRLITKKHILHNRKDFKQFSLGYRKERYQSNYKKAIIGKQQIIFNTGQHIKQNMVIKNMQNQRIISVLAINLISYFLPQKKYKKTQKCY